MNKTKYNHTEAFWLMTYTCQDCGHKKEIWNSRDGVTPFGTRCMACGENNMLHKGPHEYAPNHVSRQGQYIWIDFPASLRLPFGRGRVQSGDGTDYQVNDEETRKEIAAGIAEDMQPGAPYLVRWFPRPMGQEQRLLQQEVKAMHRVIMDFAPDGFPLLEFDSGAEALHVLLDEQRKQRIAQLPDPTSIATELVNEWLLERQGLPPIPIGISKLNLAIVEAMANAIDSAYQKGQADGGGKEQDEI